MDNQQFIYFLTNIVEENLSNEDFGVKDLALKARLSHSGLHRRLKRITGHSASRFIREIRLQKAKTLLLNEDISIAEVAYQVGFGSHTYFSRCFHEYFGYPPAEARRIGGEYQVQSPGGNKKPSVNLKKTRIIRLTILAFISSITLGTIIVIVLNIDSDHAAEINSIAILPFHNDSSNSLEALLFTGMMESITTHLSNINSLNVLARSLSEKYDTSDRNFSEIARELEVKYLIRANGQRHGNKVLVNIQLIEGNTGEFILSEQYEKAIESVDDLIGIQVNIAQDIVLKVDAFLSPEEEEEISRIPTTNLKAYEKYLEAQAHRKIEYGNQNYSNREVFVREIIETRDLLQKAIELDPAFVDARATLGHIYIDHFPMINMHARSAYLDSGFHHLNMALEYDPENRNALFFKYQYFLMTGKIDEASRMEPLIFGSDNKDPFYFTRRSISAFVSGNHYQGIEAFYDYIDRKPDNEKTLPYLYRNVIKALYSSGFPDVAAGISGEQLDIWSDSVKWFNTLARIAFNSGDYGTAMEYLLNSCRIKPNHCSNLEYLMRACLYKGDYSRALTYLELNNQCNQRIQRNWIPDYHVAIIYQRNGMPRKADSIFRVEIERETMAIKNKLPSGQNYRSHYNLALIYFSMGKRLEGMHYLGMLAENGSVDYGMINSLSNFHFLKFLASDPDFQELFVDLQENYLDLNQRVEKLLIKRGVLGS